MHHPCAEPVWRLPGHGARCRILSLRPSLLLRALGGAFLTRTTAASLALCAIEQPHLAKKSPFARAGPTSVCMAMDKFPGAQNFSVSPRKLFVRLQQGQCLNLW